LHPICLNDHNEKKLRFESNEVAKSKIYHLKVKRAKSTKNYKKAKKNQVFSQEMKPIRTKPKRTHTCWFSYALS